MGGHGGTGETNSKTEYCACNGFSIGIYGDHQLKKRGELRGKPLWSHSRGGNIIDHTSKALSAGLQANAASLMRFL